MFSVCPYCESSNCWGHTNDEKSAMDMAKKSGDAASHYYAQLEAMTKSRDALAEKLAIAVEALELMLTRNFPRSVDAEIQKTLSKIKVEVVE